MFLYAFLAVLSYGIYQGISYAYEKKNKRELLKDTSKGKFGILLCVLYVIHFPLHLP